MVISVLLWPILISLLLSVYIWAITIRHCKSEKRHYFILTMSAIIFYVLGYMIEITAMDAEVALVGVKILYIGSTFMTVFYLLFIMDYCEVKIPRKIVTPFLLSAPIIAQPLIWTTEHNHFLYSSYSYNAEKPFLGLTITTGPGYGIIQFLCLTHVFISCYIIIKTMRKYRKKKRSPLFLLLLATVSPLIAHLLYILFVHAIESPYSGLNFMPYAIVITNSFLYINIVRYDVLDMTSKAYSISFDLLGESIIFVDSDMNYNGCNNAAYKVFPDLKSVRKGTPVTQIPHWPYELNDLSYETDYDDINFEMSIEENRYYIAEINPINSKKGVLGYIILIRDVTDVTLLMNQLQAAAHTDGLTGLNNRRRFMELAEGQMEKSKREGKPCSAMLLDIDFFKKCNDTYGHLFGDEVLRIISKQLKNSVRPYDFLGRYGGEEFVLFITDSEYEGGDFAMLLAERIRKKIESTSCIYGGFIAHVTCSIGIAARVGDESLNELLDRADKALYHAKRNGRNQTAHYSDIAAE